MAEYRVKRTFSGNRRGTKVELTNAEAKYLLDAEYVAEIQTTTGDAPAPAKKTARKRAAKKAAGS